MVIVRGMMPLIAQGIVWQAVLGKLIQAALDTAQEAARDMALELVQDKAQCQNESCQLDSSDKGKPWLRCLLMLPIIKQKLNPLNG